MEDNFKKIIEEVISIVDNQTNDWFIIKRMLVNLFPPRQRCNFSRRHYSTKKHILNSFDKEILTYWEEKTGIKLWINPDKLHPIKWKRHRRGWGLKKYNAKRKEQIEILNRKNRKRRDREDKRRLQG